ncbi:MAG: 2-oxoglutarate dehydrogenase complex dihydrolipoyllysine-residue succinyltransferase [Cardiobacteriaceae bacterium]|nr:2-oxoglutarate dehydrogenase complex dihydrolipoyllysine-residue succinyltransferase [Cardiobacteriaceae bacterium]
MTIEVKVPQLPESVADATLVNWHKKVGDYVAEGENLVDLETDKVVLEVPAPVGGILKEIKQQDGSTVTADVVVAIMEAAAAPAASPAQAATAPAPAATPSQAVAAAPAASANVASSPSARKLAAENGVAIAEVAGSGRAGRISKQDVAAHISAGGSRHEERVPMTRLRKRIAERLLDAKNTTAMLTTFNEVDMKAVMDLRKKHQDAFVDKHDIKLGFMSFFVRAAVAALKEWPAVNAAIDGEDLVYHNYQDIGIAVSSPRGLVVPILRNAENMGFAEIEGAIKDFAVKAKNSTLSIEEMTGGTFTITNGGTFGSMLSTPILNPPQSAILGMHNIVERPVVVNGEIVIRPIMYLALSYDHRIIDGREAVGFLVSIKKAIEDPTRLLFNI